MPESVSTSVSINGGPEIPFGKFKDAAQRVRRGSGKGPIAAIKDVLDQDATKAAATKAAPSESTSNTGGISADRLRSIVDRIERLEEERKALGSDIKDIYAEAASAGFEVKVLRQLIRIRKQEPDVIEEQETLLDLYRRSLGM